MNHARALQSLILHNPECVDLIEAGNDQAIADLISIGRVRVVSTEIGVGTILATLGADGGLFLDGLVELGQSDRNVFWAMDLVRQGIFDVGMPGTRTQMRALGLSQPEIAPLLEKILALAEVPDPYTAEQVSIALRGPWGDGLEQPFINAEEASDAVKQSESEP